MRTVFCGWMRALHERRAREKMPAAVRVCAVWYVWFCAVGFFSAAYSQSQPITDEAQTIFAAHKESVCQIRVSDRTSGEKAALGSGFFFDARGYIATNYHVISLAVLHPTQYRIEYVNSADERTEVSIVNFDVVHDIAIVKALAGVYPALKLGNSTFPKGTRIFSMGNPHDLGMSIVEGTFNGFLEKAMYPKLLFSGSLNPGMSGGPALSHAGEVIGVNVATSGNEISFLVPVEYLAEVYAVEREQGIQSEEAFNSYIQQQLIRNQDAQMEELLSKDWALLPVGPLLVPGEITPILKCWSSFQDKPKDMYKSTEVACDCEDRVFVGEGVYSSTILYNYKWLESKRLNPLRFYALYSHNLAQVFPFKNAAKNDVTNFKCSSSFVTIAGKTWRMILCSRAYYRFPQLRDVCVQLALLGQPLKGFLIELNMLGITKERAKAFLKRFVTETQWQK